MTLESDAGRPPKPGGTIKTSALENIEEAARAEEDAREVLKRAKVAFTVRFPQGYTPAETETELIDTITHFRNCYTALADTRFKNKDDVAAAVANLQSATQNLRNNWKSVARRDPRLQRFFAEGVQKLTRENDTLKRTYANVPMLTEKIATIDAFRKNFENASFEETQTALRLWRELQKDIQNPKQYLWGQEDDNDTQQAA